MIPIPFPSHYEHQYQPCLSNNFSYSYPCHSVDHNFQMFYYLPQMTQWNDNQQFSYIIPSHTPQLKESEPSLFEPECEPKIQTQNKGKKQRLFRPKKNVESNISNQVFSYITNDHKSKQSLLKIFKDDHKKVETFYTYIDVFTRTKKKYLSRKYLGELCVLAESRQEFVLIKKKKREHLLQIDEFRTAINLLIFHYLRQKCVLNILTSIKLSSDLRVEHLKRRRQILNFLEEYVKPDFRFK